jgi:trans-aconitate methyltransferase
MEWIADKYDCFQKNHQLQYGLDLLSRLESIESLIGKTVLDLGCGNGELTLILEDRVGRSGRITAVDVDGGMLNSLRMKKGSEEIEIHQSDAIGWLKSTGQTYDAIFSNAVLHWLNSYGEFNEVLQEANKCLCRSGYLTFRFSLQDNAKEAKTFLEEQLRDYTGDESLTLRRSIFGYDQCLACFERHSYRVVVSEELKYTPFAESEMSFQWMVNSQPILAYLEERRLEGFEEVLWQRWQQERVEVESHHGLFIAQKL